MAAVNVDTSNDDNPDSTDVSDLQEKVKRLYDFRDKYIEMHGIDEAKLKSERIQARLDELLQDFDRFSGPMKQKNGGLYHCLKGKALNVTSEYKAEVEEELSKAIKLDPKSVEAWNELGECYWKKGDIAGAQRCFNGAFQQQQNKVSLRNLSIILRQLPTNTAEERTKNVEEGIAKAKAAVELDMTDGRSWCILGNAYLSSYFAISQTPTTLKLCMSSYLQAEKDTVAKNDPDLHYNRGIALKYEEEFQQALQSFEKASALDPMWEQPNIQTQMLLKYLDNVQDLVHNKGKLKIRKIKTLLQKMEALQLGPYKGGSFTKGGQTVKLDLIPFSKLNAGTNAEKVICGKVVCSVHTEDAVPFTFCMIDKDEHCIAVTVFNLAKGKGVIIGDSVAIPEPFFTKVNVRHQDKTFDFDLVRVEIPLIMVINGKKVGASQHSTAQMSTFAMND